MCDTTEHTATYRGGVEGRDAAVSTQPCFVRGRAHLQSAGQDGRAAPPGWDRRGAGLAETWLQDAASRGGNESHCSLCFRLIKAT